MTIKKLKEMNGYEFECNMSDEYKDYDICDEWGCAFVWLGNIGAEYNFCIDINRENKEIYTACAIYKIEFDNNYMKTNYDIFVHYDIDFNKSNWKEELENAMCKALIEFYNL